MAKAIIEFDLNELDDLKAHLRAVKSLDMALALWDIRNLKKGLEWSIDNKDIDKNEVLEMVFEKIYEILDNYNIQMDELIH